VPRPRPSSKRAGDFELFRTSTVTVYPSCRRSGESLRRSVRSGGLPHRTTSDGRRPRGGLHRRHGHRTGMHLDPEPNGTAPRNAGRSARGLTRPLPPPIAPGPAGRSGARTHTGRDGTRGVDTGPRGKCRPRARSGDHRPRMCAGSSELPPNSYPAKAVAGGTPRWPCASDKSATPRYATARG
jgi:hypothetical protein